MGGLAERMKARTRAMADAHLAAPETHARVGARARGMLAKRVALDATTPLYKRFVDGVEGASEDAVILDGGTIIYKFGVLPAAARFMLALAAEVSPRLSGAYAGAWFLVVNGQPWTGKLDDIPILAELKLTNFAPYARKIEAGTEVHIRGAGGHAAKTSRRAGNFQPAKSRYLITEIIASRVRSKFPSLAVSREYVAIPSGSGASAANPHGWAIPYILQTGPTAGESVLYPAVSIAARG